MLKDKKILLGVSGSIAAYKIAYLVRLLIKQGAAVRVVMTPSAQQFITSLTLSTLSKNAVYTDVSSEDGWHNHVELGLWADVMVIAPATANTIAKLANGNCDNMLLAAYLSSRCPVMVAPAMDLDMWTHPATQHNIDKLLSYGNQIIPVEDGELASGLVGKGRMAEPEQIVGHLIAHFSAINQTPLTNKTVLITSGPTQEAIDPVRFISNHSSGKMGAALAEKAACAGAKVLFVSGPAKVLPQHPAIQILSVLSAQQMYETAIQYAPQADVLILAAAVADYTPQTVATQKMKKKTDEFSIPLKKTKDIAAELGKLKTEQQLMVGFALETNNALEHAKGKLVAKNLDLIVLNTLADEGAGFGYDTNKVTLVERNGTITRYDIKTKEEVAEDIVNKITSLLH